MTWLHPRVIIDIIFIRNRLAVQIYIKIRPIKCLLVELYAVYWYDAKLCKFENDAKIIFKKEIF